MDCSLELGKPLESFLDEQFWIILQLFFWSWSENKHELAMLGTNSNPDFSNVSPELRDLIWPLLDYDPVSE